MCFACGEAPTCCGVRIEGEAVTWRDGAAVAGTGTIVAGAPSGF